VEGDGGGEWVVDGTKSKGGRGPDLQGVMQASSTPGYLIPAKNIPYLGT
jgi:hypothetical protein